MKSAMDSILTLFQNGSYPKTATATTRDVVLLFVLFGVSIILNLFLVFYKKKNRFKKIANIVVLMFFPWFTISQDIKEGTKVLFDSRKEGNMKFVELMLLLASGLILLTVTFLQIRQPALGTSLNTLKIGWVMLLLSIFFGLSWFYNLSNIELFYRCLIQNKNKAGKSTFIESADHFFSGMARSNALIFLEYLTFFVGVLFIVIYGWQNT